MIERFKKYITGKTQFREEDFDVLLPELQSKKIKKEAVLLRQDEICSEVYFVTNGLLRSYTVDNDGKQHVIQFAPEDHWISDRSSFCFNEPAMFFIDAIEDTEVICLQKDFYTKAETMIPGFNSFNSLALNNSIRFLQRRINLLLAATAEERYLDFIRLYPSLTLRVPQWMIASYLGITPESLSRVRKTLASRNFKP